MDKGGNFLHAVSTGILFRHFNGQGTREEQSNNTQHGSNNGEHIHSLQILSYFHPEIFLQCVLDVSYYSIILSIYQVSC